MRAAVATRPGPPEVLEVRTVPRPEPRPGWTLVEVKAFGLNRSELMTRQGHSPGVRFPRILGIECVGVVAGGTAYPEGTTVAAVMGEMGRAFDGGYAEYALLPDDLLIPVTSTLDWPTLAALPETYLTARGSLDALDLAAGMSLLVRGGTSSVGMAALSLAKARGVETIATTRNPAKADLLKTRGADHVVIDAAGDPPFADRVREIAPAGPDRVLDLVGAPTTADSLSLVRKGGVVCLTGMLSGVWSIPDFQPVSMIPTGTRLTAYHSDDAKGVVSTAALQDVVDGVADGRYHANVDRVFTLDEIAAAHHHMESNQATGKVVVDVSEAA
ncbi:zinc-binding dehydrogenase [Streptosporangiaceae bacterium NEAU-GS5]|nr:zinc-binding dehydrogenase [Streptosporangiaceae bacterium NEAU-GS5]